MKKLLLFLMLVFVCVCFCSCKNEYSVEGVENFKLQEGHFELNTHLLPSKDFLEKYTYKNAQYNYKEKYKSILSWNGTECSLIVISYGTEEYLKAKMYCMEEMDLLKSFKYNDYIFAENIELAVAQDRYSEDNANSFPHWFNMFAYNDEKCCLVFMGAYIENQTPEDAQAVTEHWGDFLQKHFAKFYDFDAM